MTTSQRPIRSQPATEQISDVFQARRVCAAALEQTLDELFERPGITELQFRDTWLAKIASNPTMTLDGWYSPPPKGATVLAAPAFAPRRLNFKSLRDPSCFPKDEPIRWREGWLYAYCSNLSVPLRFAGDFSITLYFGHDDAVLRYYRLALSVARELALRSLALECSGQVFRLGQTLLHNHGLTNTVHSVTDVSPLDYGHSLMKVDSCLSVQTSNLSEEVRETVSRSRKFINDVTNWRLADVDAYTIEPQVKAIQSKQFPKLSFHYLLTQRHGQAIEASGEPLIQRYLGENP